MLFSSLVGSLITTKKNIFRRWRDSNPRPPGPQSDSSPLHHWEPKLRAKTSKKRIKQTHLGRKFHRITVNHTRHRSRGWTSSHWIHIHKTRSSFFSRSDNQTKHSINAKPIRNLQILCFYQEFHWFISVWKGQQLMVGFWAKASHTNNCEIVGWIWKKTRNDIRRRFKVRQERLKSAPRLKVKKRKCFENMLRAFQGKTHKKVSKHPNDAFRVRKTFFFN